MTKPKARAVAAPPFRIALAVTLTVIVSLALLLAPRPSHAAGDAEVLGKWISDKNDPAMDFTMAAGTAPGTFLLTVPAKALGGKAGESVILQRTSAGKFETMKGSILRGSFTVTGPKHAEFKAMENTKQSFHIIDQLLERP
ncbi:MAG: hypothetical protein ACXWKN_04430 [Phenylobacterium sp.]